MKKEKCPLCKSSELNYSAETEDWGTEGELSIEVRCTKSNCGWVGYVVYKVQFSRMEGMEEFGGYRRFWR